MEIGAKVSIMERGRIWPKQERNMMVIGLMANTMVSVPLCGQMGLSTKESGATAKKTVEASSAVFMEQYTKGSGLTGNTTEEANYRLLMEKYMQESLN
jgi:hypothetical protein